MNINYDNTVYSTLSILVVDDLDNTNVLYDRGAVMYSKEEEVTKYPNLDYFNLFGTDKTNKDKHWWGSDAKVTYCSDRLIVMLYILYLQSMK